MLAREGPAIVMAYQVSGQTGWGRRIASVVFPAMLGLAALAIVAVSLVSAGRWAGFVVRAESASAVVDRIERVRSPGSGRGVTYRPVFRIIDGPGAGELARSRNHNSWRRYAVPQAVTVWQDPADRGWAEADSLPSLFLGPVLGLLFAAFALGAAWLFLPAWVLGTEGKPIPPPRTYTKKTIWGVAQVTESGTGLPGRLKLLLAGPGIAGLILIAFVFAHGEVSSALAYRDVSAVTEGRVALRVKERQLIGGEFRPLHITTIRFRTPDGREIALDAERDAAIRGLSPGDPVPVRYLRHDPQSARPASLWDEWHRSLFAALVFLVVLVSGTWFLRRKLGPWWREEQGMRS
ncbi:DUF3592 domain-containing protein [Muricoccus radiodurans]|uniref:DUF3592 domain-containing protein n=1 Tax=Muricoccus radiodurans TaxID=2231721 RepID=UPI003CE770BA